MNTLSDILQRSGSELRIYEMGRQIRLIENQDFHKMEINELAYPAPIQQQARFALCFWQKQQANTPYIWFLQLPVDEQGFIQLGARDQFIHMVVDALGQQLDQQPNQQQQQNLANNQYIYKPIEEKLAYFNALYKKHYALPASTHYEPTRRYLSQESAWNHWQHLGLQGIADVVARLDSDGNSKLLANALPKLPMEVANKTLELLEHADIDQQLSHVIVQQHREVLAKDENLASLYLRALSGCSVPNLVSKAINAQLHSAKSIHSFIAIAGRLWRALQHPMQLKNFLEALAKQQDPELFQQIFADLVFIPSLRSFVLAQLQDPNNSAELQASISQLIQGYQPAYKH